MSYSQLLLPSTWRTLGLSVGLGYAGSGLYQCLLPLDAGKRIFRIDSERSDEVQKAVELYEPLIGARDLSVAAAILAFFYSRQNREMGVVIVAGTILCYADVIALALRRGLTS